MPHHPIPQRQMALIAGLSLLLMAVVAGFAYGYAFQKIQAGQSTNSIFWLRCCIAGFMLVLLLDILVAWALYFFMRPAGRHLSLLSCWLRLVYAALLGAALLHLVTCLELIDQGNSSLPHQATTVYLDLFAESWSIGLIVFGCHLAVLGSQIIGAGYVPKILGFLLLIAAACYSGCSLMQLLWQGYAYYKADVELLLSAPMAAGELALALWLVVKGGKVQKVN